MTEIKHPLLNQSLIWSDNLYTCLNIENPHFLLTFLGEIAEQTQNGDGRFILIEDGAESSFAKKCFLVTDPLSLKRDEKKETTAYIKEITAKLTDDQMEMLADINRDISNFVSSFNESGPLPIDFDKDINAQNLLKSIGASISTQSEEFLTSLLDGLKAISHIYKIGYFFICHLKAYLTQEEIQKLISECRKNDFGIFLIESNQGYPVENAEKSITVDRDLAEI